jgi:hypothetical protein
MGYSQDVRPIRPGFGVHSRRSSVSWARAVSYVAAAVSMTHDTTSVANTSSRIFVIVAVVLA